MRLQDLGEFGFLDLLHRRLGAPGPQVVVGLGDDATVLTWPPGCRVVVSTDAVVEGRHFRREWLSERQIGERAVRAALSDLAAMGARPRGAWASCALPPALEVEAAQQLLLGLDAGVRACGASLLGGDLTASPGPIFLDVVVLGEAEAVWTRHGAQPQDALLVSGDLGRSRAALHLLERGCDLASLPPPLAERFALPQPAFDLVRALQPLGVVTAAIDISDGLLADLGHLTRSSGVAAELAADCLPLAETVRSIAPTAQQEPLQWALSGGEEYELLLTVPPGEVSHVLRAAQSAGARPLTVVGRIVPGQGVRVYGAATPGSATGFDHFRQ